MPDAPACLSAVADSLTFLARYPSFDGLYGDCRHGWRIVPVALPEGWPTRPGNSLASVARERGRNDPADLLDTAAVVQTP